MGPAGVVIYFKKMKTVLRGHSLTMFTIFSSFLANYLCTPVDICANLYLHNGNTKIFVDNLVLSLRNSPDAQWYIFTYYL